MRSARRWIALLAIALASPTESRADAGAEAPATPPSLLARGASRSGPCETSSVGEPPRLDSPRIETTTSIVRPVPLEPCPFPRASLFPRFDAGRRYLVPTVESAGAVAITVAANKWVGKARWANITLDSIARNIRSEWVFDDDQFSINQFGHPYQGLFPYTAARSSGFGFWGSTVFVFGSSLVWEFAGETEPPAINDQFTTVIGGVALGEMAHRFAETMRALGGGWRVLGFALDPFAEVNQHVLGPLPEERREHSRSIVGAGFSLWTGGDETRVGGARPRVSFRHRTGLASDPSLQLQRPFDHFDVEAAYGGGNGVTMRVRGLVAGRKLGDTPRLRGFWGAFLSYDYDSPPAEFRTSSSAIGVGAVLSADIGKGFEVGGTVLGSGVLLGTAGEVQSPRLEQRNYVMGPGAQGLLELQLDARDRVLAAVELRQTAVFGAESRQGEEIQLHSRAGVLVRISGPHGLGAEYTEYRRIAHDPLQGSIRQRGDIVSVYYSFSSGGWLRGEW